jgi:hypothetical protein
MASNHRLTSAKQAIAVQLELTPTNVATLTSSCRESTTLKYSALTIQYMSDMHKKYPSA